MPQVAYETLWDTTQFNSMWPKDGSNPFVLSYGDEKGYGTHADYLFGWKGDALQRAMDSPCMFQACENGRPLKSQNVAKMNKCAVEPFHKESIDNCRSTSVLSRNFELIHSQGFLIFLANISRIRIKSAMSYFTPFITDNFSCEFYKRIEFT
jgi:hypothetical protein